MERTKVTYGLFEYPLLSLADTVLQRPFAKTHSIALQMRRILSAFRLKFPELKRNVDLYVCL